MGNKKLPATYGEALTAILAEKQMTYYRLGQLTKINPSMLFKYLEGSSTPNWESAAKIALALEVSLDAFLSSNIKLPAPPEKRGAGRPSSKKPTTKKPQKTLARTRRNDVSD